MRFVFDRLLLFFRLGWWIRNLICVIGSYACLLHLDIGFFCRILLDLAFNKGVGVCPFPSKNSTNFDKKLFSQKDPFFCFPLLLLKWIGVPPRSLDCSGFFRWGWYFLGFWCWLDFHAPFNEAWYDYFL